MQSSTVQMLVAARRLADYATELGADVASQEIRPAYEHMGALLADSILQAGLNYNSVVRPRIITILARYPDQDRTSTLLNVVYRGETATFLNWTHIEKIARFDSLVRYLGAKSVERTDDLRMFLHDKSFALSLREIRGIGPKTVDYMKCLSGIESIAVDRHVKTFARRVGITETDYDYLKSVFCCAADLMSVSRRQFDAWVWRQESSVSKPQIAFAF